MTLYITSLGGLDEREMVGCFYRSTMYCLWKIRVLESRRLISVVFLVDANLGARIFSQSRQSTNLLHEVVSGNL